MSTPTTTPDGPPAVAPGAAWRELLREERQGVWTQTARWFVLGAVVLAGLWARVLTLEMDRLDALRPVLERFLPLGLVLSLLGPRPWIAQPLPQVVSTPAWQGAFVHLCLVLSMISLVALLTLPLLAVRAGQRPGAGRPGLEADADRRFSARWLAFVLPFAGAVFLAALLLGGRAMAHGTPLEVLWPPTLLALAQIALTAMLGLGLGVGLRPAWLAGIGACALAWGGLPALFGSLARLTENLQPTGPLTPRRPWPGDAFSVSLCLFAAWVLGEVVWRVAVARLRTPATDGERGRSARSARPVRWLLRGGLLAVVVGPWMGLAWPERTPTGPPPPAPALAGLPPAPRAATWTDWREAENVPHRLAAGQFIRLGEYDRARTELEALRWTEAEARSVAAPPSPRVRGGAGGAERPNWHEETQLRWGHLWLGLGRYGRAVRAYGRVTGAGAHRVAALCSGFAYAFGDRWNEAHAVWEEGPLVQAYSLPQLRDAVAQAFGYTWEDAKMEGHLVVLRELVRRCPQEATLHLALARELQGKTPFYNFALPVCEPDFVRQMYALARQHYTAALELDPANVDALLGLGRYAELVQAAPDDLTVYERGASYVQSSEPTPAGEAFCREALRRRPNDPQVHRLVAGVYRKWGRWTEARQLYQQALRQAPEDGPLLWDWICTANELGLAGECEAALQRLRANYLRDHPHGPDDTDLVRGYLAHLRGEVDTARKAYRQVLQAPAGQDDLARYGLALLYLGQGQPDAALEMTEPMGAQGARTALLDLLRIEAFQRVGRLEEATELAVNLGDELSFSSFQVLGPAVINLGEMFRQTHERHPEGLATSFLFTQHRLRALLFNPDQPRSSTELTALEQTLRRLVQAVPGWPGPFRELSILYTLEGDAARAEAAAWGWRLRRSPSPE